MSPQNKQIFEDNKHHYETLTVAGFVKGFNSAEKDNMLRAVREEFAPNYNADLYCPPCIADMIKFAYNKYKEYEQANAEQSTTQQLSPVKQDTPNSNHRRKSNHR